MEFIQLATRSIILYKCVNDLYAVYFERFLQMRFNVYIFILFKVSYIFEISKQVSISLICWFISVYIVYGSIQLITHVQAVVLISGNGFF